METVAALLTALGNVSKMITDLVRNHQESLAAKEKEIADLKKIIDGLKEPPK